MGGSRRNHIPHSGRVHCHVWRTEFPIQPSDQIIQKQTSMLQGFHKIFKKCFLVETVGLCLFSLHICLAACLTLEWRGWYTCFLPNWRRKYCFKMGWALLDKVEATMDIWALDLHSTEGCVKHGSWYWNLFTETWGGTGSVFSTQWEAYMVKAMNSGRGSATWVHHGQLSTRLAFNWNTKQGCGRWCWSLFLRHEVVLAVSVVHNAGNTRGCVKHGRWHWILFIETLGATGGVYTNIESFLLRRVVVSSGVYTIGGIHGLDFDVISLVSDAWLSAHLLLYLQYNPPKKQKASSNSNWTQGCAMGLTSMNN